MDQPLHLKEAKLPRGASRVHEPPGTASSRSAASPESTRAFRAHIMRSNGREEAPSQAMHGASGVGSHRMIECSAAESTLSVARTRSMPWLAVSAARKVSHSQTRSRPSGDGG